MRAEQNRQTFDNHTEPEDSGEVSTHTRQLTGIWFQVFYLIAVGASVFHIAVNTLDFMVMPAIFRNAIHLGFVLMMAFVLYPWSKRHPDRGLGVDLLLCILAVVVTLYILLFQQELNCPQAVEGKSSRNSLLQLPLRLQWTLPGLTF